MIPIYITTEAQPPPSKECKKQSKKHISKRFHQFMPKYTLHPPLPEDWNLPGSLTTTLATLQPFMPARNPLVEAPDTCAASTKALTTASDVSSNGTFLARRDYIVTINQGIKDGGSISEGWEHWNCGPLLPPSKKYVFFSRGFGDMRKHISRSRVSESTYAWWDPSHLFLALS